MSNQSQLKFIYIATVSELDYKEKTVLTKNKNITGAKCKCIFKPMDTALFFEDIESAKSYLDKLNQDKLNFNPNIYYIVDSRGFSPFKYSKMSIN